MNNEILVKKKVHSLLSLQVEAVQNDTVEVTGTSRGTPVKVKVKVRKKDKVDAHHNVISIPIKNPSSSATEKIRLVNSDQTIMSCDMIMETDQTSPNKKHRHKFLELIRPGICLGNANDDTESYRPSQQKQYSITSKSDEILKKHLALTKNDYFDVSSVVSKRHQNFLGKCKPGGCLDPPFGEDKYSYVPFKKPLQLETSTFTTKSLCLGDDVRALNRCSLNKSMSSKNKLSRPGSITDIKVVQDQPQTNSILNLYQAESVNTSLSMTYSNSIITYPPPLTPSEIRLNNEKITQQRTSTDNKSRKSFNEFSQTFFITPKEITNQIRHKNYDQEKSRSNDENDTIHPALRVKSETSNEEHQLSTPVQSNKNIENITQGISGTIITPTKPIEQFNILTSTKLKATPSVDDIIGKNEEALIHYAQKDITLLSGKNDNHNESVYEAVPTVSSKCESTSLETHSKAANLTIKSVDTIVKPSIRSSLAETNLNISKTLTDKLGQQGLILNKTLPPSLEDDNNNNSADKINSIQIKESKSDPKNLYKPIESFDDKILKKQDILPKNSTNQLSQQEVLLLGKALNLPLPSEVNENSSEKKSSIQDSISKSTSLINETDKPDKSLVTQKLDNEINKNYVNDESKDETKDFILRTGLNSEVNQLLEEAVNETNKKPSILNNSVTSEISRYSRDLKHSQPYETESTASESINKSVSEIKEQQSDLLVESINLSSKTEKTLSPELIENSVNLNLEDSRKLVSTDNNLIVDKTENNHIVESNISTDKGPIEEISKRNGDYVVEKQESKTYFKDLHNGGVSSKSEFTDLEILIDSINKPLTVSQVTYPTISETSGTNNYDTNETNYTQNQIKKDVLDNLKQIESDVNEKFKEIIKENSFQQLEYAHADVRSISYQGKDLSYIDITSLPEVLANQNLENPDIGNKMVVSLPEENPVRMDIIPSIGIPTNVVLELSKEDLQSDKFQEDESINPTEEVTMNQPQNLVHDNKNQSKDSGIEKDISNIQMDKSSSRLLDKKSNILEMVDAKEEILNLNLEVTTVDTSRMVPNKYGDQVNREIKRDVLDKPSPHVNPYANVDYSDIYATSEPIEAHDTSNQSLDKSEIGNIKLINEMTMNPNVGKTDQITTDKNVNMEYNKLINNENIQNVTANSILPKITSKEFTKHNLTNGQINKADESESTKSEPLEKLYTTITELKDEQNIIVDNIDDKGLSSLERFKTEKLSTIFDVIEIPDSTKLKREIIALKSRSVLYTPSESTINKTLNIETVAVDLAFHTYVNEENKIFLKTFDSENEPQRYTDDKVIIIKSDVNLYNNEMKIPIDSEKSLLLQIKKVNKLDHTQPTVLKDAEIFHHTTMVNKLPMRESQDAKAINLHCVYEKDLLPLQNAIKELKDEIEHLASHSSLLKNKLITGKSKPLRLTNINKRCVCLKRLF